MSSSSLLRKSHIAQEPVLQVNGVHAAGPGASREAGGDVLGHVACDLDWDWLGDVP
jgi:hypothetical protein